MKLDWEKPSPEKDVDQKYGTFVIGLHSSICLFQRLPLIILSSKIATYGLQTLLDTKHSLRALQIFNWRSEISGANTHRVLHYNVSRCIAA